MKLSRRDTLKACGVAVGAWLLPLNAPGAARAMDRPSHRSKAMLVDLTLCIGCGWCQQACKQWNDLPAVKTYHWDCGEKQLSLSAKTWTLVECREVKTNSELYQVFVKRQCMHCLDPACISACPVGALQKAEFGAVVYDPSRCIGCRYCMVACPFGVPKYEWDTALPLIQKCTFCAERQEAGLRPTCADACPTGALLFGERDALIAEAEARIQAQPEQYVNHIYGKEEFGGTSWMYLSPVPFASLGFPALSRDPATRLSETVATFGMPGLALSVSLLLGGVYYWFNRLEGSALADEPVRQEDRGIES